MIVDLPEEVLVHIFEYLDYKSLQCIAVQVCKEWLSIIRNDCKLSGELKIKQFKHEDLPNIKEFSDMLSKWEKLKVLISQNRELSLDFDFKCCKSLEKVICPNYYEENFMPPWGKLTWISYDPFAVPNPGLLNYVGPQDGLELRILCCGDSRRPGFYYDASENVWPMKDISMKMDKLETLLIWYINYNDGNFDFCLPLLNGLQTCKSLRELKLDYVDIPDYCADLRIQCNPNFSSFIDKISEHCLNLTDLVIEFTTDKSESRTWRNPLPLAWIKWIPNLRNCEKLTLNTHIAPKYGNFEPFFQNPMMHLKEVNLGACGAFLRDLFLINLFEAFPNLQKLNINLPKANATIKWKIENLTLVLKTLAKVKNLKISNLEVYLERGNDESRDEILGFLTEALEITQQKFSEDISDFKIQEDHYGFIMSKEKLNFVKLNNCLKIDGHTVKDVEYSEQEKAVILKLVDHADVIMSEDLARKIANMLIEICESKKEINHLI